MDRDQRAGEDLDIEAIRLHPQSDEMRDYGGEECERLIRCYMRLYDQLEPIVVYQQPDGGYVLSNGRLRLEAAKRLGRRRVRALVRQGNANAALADHVVIHQQQERPLSLEDYKMNARRLFGRGCTVEQVAEALSLPLEVVRELPDLEDW